VKLSSELEKWAEHATPAERRARILARMGQMELTAKQYVSLELLLRVFDAEQAGRHEPADLRAAPNGWQGSRRL
jgi:hypothetical protein